MEILMIKKRFLYFAAVIFAAMLLIIPVSAAKEATYQNTDISANGFTSPELLTDESQGTYTDAFGNATVTITRKGIIQGVYIIFDQIPKEWTITEPSSKDSVTCGTNGFLHEYVDVAALFGDDIKKVKLTFPKGTVISEIYAFSAGEIPDWVQRWEAPCEKADLMLISSHSDDEQLFFAGVLPYYAIEKGVQVQVVYVVNHFDTHERPHEQLDGLWAVGVKNYPIIPEFPDVYAESTDREVAKADALAAFGSLGYTFDDFVEYFTECIRRFKPLVVVSHDLNGEYGHGTHVVCADALIEAIKYSPDSGKCLESSEEYGTWVVEKTYLHLYGENQMTLDIDKPLESLGGKTAFQVSQEGFKHHKSQLWTWFKEWMLGTDDEPITKASQIEDYTPGKYGLYFTNVGNDTGKGDFFENVKTHEQREADAETETEATLAPLVTLPSDFIEITTQTEETTEDAVTGSDNDSDSSPNKPIIIAIILICALACVVLAIFTVKSTKTNVRMRKRKLQNRKNKR